MFPRRYYLVVFAFLMSLFMSLAMSGVVVALQGGESGRFLYQWLVISFPGSFLVAFPLTLLITPVVRYLSEALMAKEGR